MWQSFGHTKAKHILDKQLEQQLFPHAYLFTGPQGVGKKLVAQEMAGRILNASRLDNHPDYIYYDAGSDQGVEGLRQFLQQLANKPFLGQYKVAIIDNMDQANVQMSNALLKTLEEPSPSTILFVIAGQNNLLPTIISRCQSLAFSPLAREDLQQFAAAKGLAADEALVQASFGSPGRLLQLVNDGEAVAEITSAVDKLSAAENSGQAEKILAINELAELETEQIKEVLLTWLYQLRSQLSEQPQLGELMSRICEALPHLNGSFNKKMVLQRLLLHSYETA